MSDTYPKKVSENGWYELSDGTRVRGEDEAIQAQAVIDDGGEVETDETGDPIGLADPATAADDGEPEEASSEDALSGKSCANCELPATVKDAPRTANTVYYCNRHAPVYLR